MDTEIHERLIALVPRLRRFAVALTGSGEEADELVHAAVEEALDGPDDWCSGALVENRMFSIVWTLRNDQRQARGDGPAAAGAAGNPATDGRGYADGKDRLAAVRAAFTELSEDERSVLFLVCSERLTYRAAAEIVGVSVKSVATRLAGARLALYRRLTDAGDVADNIIRIPNRQRQGERS